MQRALLGNGPRSLVGQVRGLLDSATRSSNEAVTQQNFQRLFDRAFTTEFNRLNNFFETTPIRQLSTDASGNRIPLRQFLGGRIQTQLNNTLGALSQGVNSLAATSLFANGATTATPEALEAFRPQVLSALGTTAFQLGSTLAIFDDLDPVIQTDFQTGFFGNDPLVTSVFNGLQTLPNDSTLLPESMSRLIQDSLTVPFNTFNTAFNLPALTSPLPTGTIPGLFGQDVSNFGFGFNNGFGTGFIGLGQPEDGSLFNPSLGTGFGNIITTANPNFGFTIPDVIGSGGGSPIGGGGTGTVGGGTGTIGGGTGTVGGGGI
jgi:hypothetical protein